MNENGILYICDPNKNTRCNHRDCQKTCKRTMYIEFAKGGRAFRRYRLVKLRISHNLTQDQLGARIGVSGKTVYNWEAGKSVPHKKNLEKLCYILGVVDPGYMFTTSDIVMRADRYEFRTMKDLAEVSTKVYREYKRRYSKL